jgi:putative DNA primase/helicase
VFLAWHADRTFKVLYIDGEMPAAALQERLALIVASVRERSALRILPPHHSDLQQGAMPDLSTTTGQAGSTPRSKPILLW